MYVSHPIVGRLEQYMDADCIALFIRNICLLWLRHVFFLFFLHLQLCTGKHFACYYACSEVTLSGTDLWNPTAVNFTPDVCFKNDEGAAGVSCHMGYFSVCIRFWLTSQITPMCVFSSNGFV